MGYDLSLFIFCCCIFVFDDLYFSDLMSIGLVSCYPTFIIWFWFCLLALYFDFISTSQEIGWKEHLRYDLFSVEWDVKP